jgi:hypothetical protein
MDEVKDMRNIIKTEFLKLKRYSVTIVIVRIHTIHIISSQI